jgi:hypothetical protein
MEERCPKCDVRRNLNWRCWNCGIPGAKTKVKNQCVIHTRRIRGCIGCYPRLDNVMEKQS